MSGPLDARAARAAILASLVGSVTVEIYLGAAGLLSWPGTFQWIASSVVGEAAYTAVGYAWLGVGLHLAVSLGWGGVWALVASRSRRALAHPAPYGLAFGVFVFGVMQVLLWARGLWALPTPVALVHDLVDHAVFFGLPVALAYARLVAPRGEEHAVQHLHRRAA